MALKHEDFSGASLSLPDGSNSTCFFFVKHASQFTSFRLSALFLFLVELLKLLVLAVLVHHSVLQTVIFILNRCNLLIGGIQLGLLLVTLVFQSASLLPVRVFLSLSPILHLVKIELGSLERHVVFLLESGLLLQTVSERDCFRLGLAKLT